MQVYAASCCLAMLFWLTEDFGIAESVGLKQASLHIPAYTRGIQQLSALEIEDTRQIANIRIHVE